MIMKRIFSKLQASKLHCGRSTQMPASYDSCRKQAFDHFLVLDFEATCDRGSKIIPQEIIEFPVIKLNAKTLEADAQFHSYVEPTVNKELTSFCTELTGIIQDMVDGQPCLENVLKDFDLWMHENLLDKGESFVFVTSGEWDLVTMLPGQCRHFNLTVPTYFQKWINIKKAYAEVTGKYPKQDLMGMLEGLDIAHTGRHHSGIDDCRNISHIVEALLRQGYVFRATSHT